MLKHFRQVSSLYFVTVFARIYQQHKELGLCLETLVYSQKMLLGLLFLYICHKVTIFVILLVAEYIVSFHHECAA